MPEYVCFKCGKRFEMSDVNTTIACPSCASKIILKSSPAVVKRIYCD